MDSSWSRGAKLSRRTGKPHFYYRDGMWFGIYRSITVLSLSLHITALKLYDRLEYLS